MPSSLRGPDRAERDCTRCSLRRQTCDRVLPRCTRCTVDDPHRRTPCVLAPPPPVVPAPQPREPLAHYLNGHWRFTKHGHEQFGKLLFAPADFVNKVPKDMKAFVQTLISDFGRTVDELLQDDIFKWFPIVEPCYIDEYVSAEQFIRDEDPGRFLPLLHMAMLLVVSPPATALVPTFGEVTVSHTDLYKAIKALLAVVLGNVASHIHLVQTLGLVTLYEFGVGCFEQAHITLTSALTMANLALDYLADREAQLTWLLCLMTLDRMIALSAHSRCCEKLSFLHPNKLPLACPSHHPVSKDVEQRVRSLSWTNYERRSEAAIQRLSSMHEGVVRAGRILQRKNLEEPFDFSESESEPEFDAWTDDEPHRDRVRGIEKDKRGMMDQRGKPKAPDFWSGHDPQVLSLSAMLVREYYAGQPEDGNLTTPRQRDGDSWLKDCEEAALKACRGVMNMHRKKEVDIQKLSMVSMFCIMHNLTIIVRDDASNFACKFAKTFQPIMRKYAVRWPFAHHYVVYLERYMGIASHLHDRVYDY